MKKNGKTFFLTFGAMLAGLGLLLLYGSGVVPSGQWALSALAGILNAAAVISLGLKGGFCVYVLVGVLGLLLVPNKLNVLLYALFFGLYPMIKSLLERLKSKTLSWALKFLFFDLALCVFAFGFGRAFLPLLPAALGRHTSLVLLAGNGAFLVYDLGFSQLIGFYMARVGRIFEKRER